MQRIFVLSSDGKPLDPCHPARARQLLHAGRAAVFRRYPFAIVLKDRTATENIMHSYRVKVDPGSKITGLALARVSDDLVVWAGEIHHRSQRIHQAMLARRQLRHARRGRHTRYRPARFNNRRRAEGWLAPSLQSRIAHIQTWIERLRHFCPVAACSLELAKFDTHAMVNPGISGVEYQRGTLHGYEVREYLLEKWKRRCAYCGAENVPLEVEHIIPKARGGTDRASNLTLACHSCNQRKGAQTAAEFGHPEIQALARQPLTDAAAINSTRWALYRYLQSRGLQVEIGTGGRTKFNRTRLGLPKTHWIDAACVGESGARVWVDLTHKPLVIRATGHGSRQMCRVDRYGFPRTSAKSVRRVHGFKTGDIVEAKVPKGKKAGTHIGRVAIRKTGSFNITTPAGIVNAICWKYCRRLQRADGYGYQ